MLICLFLVLNVGNIREGYMHVRLRVWVSLSLCLWCDFYHL